MQEIDSEQAQEEGAEEKKPLRQGPLSVKLTAEPKILREARSLAGDRNTRITRLARIVSQDPVITLELLRVANATFFSADRPSINTVQTAVVRLGSKTITELLDSLIERPQISDPEVLEVFESLRSLCKKVSIVARIIADVTHRDISELAQTAGLMTHMGHLVGCAFLGQKYVEESRDKKRSVLPYRLIQEHHFNVDSVQLSYLRNHGVPQVLFYGLDRELKCKTPAQSALRFIVESAVEIVDAYEQGKWEKYSPGKQLPGKSALRLLAMSQIQYQQVFDTLDSYLQNPEEEGQDAKKLGEDEEGDEEYYPSQSLKSLESDSTEKSSGERSAAKQSSGTAQQDSVNRRSKSKQQKVVLNRENPPSFQHGGKKTNFITPSEEKLEEDQLVLNEDSQKVVGLLEYICRESESTDTLLRKLLKLLIIEGPFTRAALIVLNEDRDMAEIHTSVGKGFIEDDEISVNDPLSPLALCLTKVQSFNTSGIDDRVSPFGVSAYAVSPIKVVHHAPVVLYADCGLDQPLQLEARKVFRLVVGMLNNALETLSGGLPEK